MKVDSFLPVRLLTKNVRYATTAPFEGEEKWDTRKPYLINELRFNTAHCDESFICLQEVLHQQLTDVHRGLNEVGTWDFIGVGREDGHQAGEYSPIFYKPSVWRLESWETMWLSRTPEKPSKSWDAASTRILTVGVFSHRATKKRVVGMNTHLDDQGSRSRLESAKIIVHQAQKHLSHEAEKPLPVFLTGDFNSESNQEAYLEVTGDGSPMVDIYDVVPKNKQYGDATTFSGFTSETRRKRIDFIFLSRRIAESMAVDSSESRDHLPMWNAEGYAVLHNQFEDGTYNSDHRAVVGDALLR